MNRSTAWFTHAAVVSVGATGLAWAWMRYLLEPDDDFALVNHAWEPATQSLHILSAPLMVFAGGLLWQTHIRPRLARYPRRHGTGVALAVLLLPMVGSGYLVQVSVDEGWRQAWVVVHVAGSLLWLVVYAIHQRPWWGRNAVVTPSAGEDRERPGHAGARGTAARNTARSAGVFWGSSR